MLRLTSGIPRVQLRRPEDRLAPFVVDRPVNRQVFETWTEHLLVPALRPGDIVVMDNSHKGPRARALIEAAGAELRHLPACSPDLNPIEQAFAKLKQLIRSAAPRTRDALCKTIARSLDRFTPRECASYLDNAGYGQST